MQPPEPFVREAGQGPRVICLHASASSSSQWLPLMEELADRYCMAAPDFHAHGKTGWPAVSGDAIAQDAALVAQVHGAAPAHLVGHSYGGAVALAYALRHPERVLSLTLYEPAVWNVLTGDGGMEIRALAASVERDVVAGRGREAAWRFIDYWCGVGTWAGLPEARRERFAALMPRVVAQFAAIFARPAPLAGYAALEVPVLLLSGDAGPRCGPLAAERLSRTLPRAAWKRLPVLGHMGPTTEPGAVNRKIALWLAALRQVPARQRHDGADAARIARAHSRRTCSRSARSARARSRSQCCP
jgi:pimeloyl-ACP methyl ester carboxylesterase